MPVGCRHVVPNRASQPSSIQIANRGEEKGDWRSWTLSYHHALALELHSVVELTLLLWKSPRAPSDSAQELLNNVPFICGKFVVHHNSLGRDRVVCTMTRSKREFSFAFSTYLRLSA